MLSPSDGIPFVLPPSNTRFQRPLYHQDKSVHGLVGLAAAQLPCPTRPRASYVTLAAAIWRPAAASCRSGYIMLPLLVACAYIHNTKLVVVVVVEGSRVGFIDSKLWRSPMVGLYRRRRWRKGRADGRPGQTGRTNDRTRGVFRRRPA